MATIAELRSLADHARLSHRHWLQTARNGGSGSYGPAYCLDGAARWRRRLADLLRQVRARQAAIARGVATRKRRQAERGARIRAIHDKALGA